MLVRDALALATLLGLGACAAEPRGTSDAPTTARGSARSDAAPAAAAVTIGPRAALDELERPPADFTLDVVIGRGARTPEFTEAHLRPGHFILLPDGSLHHDSGRSVGWGQRPGLTRTLYQQQVSDLWTIARALGFTSPQNANFDGNPATLEPGRGQMLYIIAFGAGGERWTFVRRFSASEEPDAASVTLVRALCDLAWVADFGDERFLPVRYDFGPDPYAGFRRRR